MAEEKKSKDDKVNENKWMSDSYVIEAAKIGTIQDVKIELKASYGFTDDTDENAVKLSREARNVMKVHGQQSAIKEEVKEVKEVIRSMGYLVMKDHKNKMKTKTEFRRIGAAQSSQNKFSKDAMNYNTNIQRSAIIGKEISNLNWIRNRMGGELIVVAACIAVCISVGVGALKIQNGTLLIGVIVQVFITAYSMCILCNKCKSFTGKMRSILRTVIVFYINLFMPFISFTVWSEASQNINYILSFIFYLYMTLLELIIFTYLSCEYYKNYGKKKELQKELKNIQSSIQEITENMAIFSINQPHDEWSTNITTIMEESEAKYQDKNTVDVPIKEPSSSSSEMGHYYRTLQTYLIPSNGKDIRQHEHNDKNKDNNNDKNKPPTTD